MMNYSIVMILEERIWTSMPTDLEIAQSVTMQPITEVAQKMGIPADDLELYGKYKAKLSFDFIKQLEKKESGKLILVTAINPTRAGEGKSTTTVGLGDALNRLNKKTMMALREPSLGPVFGLKGGATGGGYAQVVPMEDINLHFTGDMHAITTTNNLVCACLDNSIHQGNVLNIDPASITFKRCLDMNDRTLRDITIGQGSKANGVERKDGFNITVASEIMAALCLADDLMDLKQRFGKMLVAYTYDGQPVTIHDLGIEGAMAMVMKDAILPNVVQTLEHNPVLIHGGPFANIAHGCNSVIATKACMKLADYTITEAGFGADLGAEKFLDIKCRFAGLQPNAVVIVATIRALKQHGGIALEDLQEENMLCSQYTKLLASATFSGSASSPVNAASADESDCTTTTFPAKSDNELMLESDFTITTCELSIYALDHVYSRSLPLSVKPFHIQSIEPELSSISLESQSIGCLTRFQPFLSHTSCARSRSKPTYSPLSSL